MDVAIRLRGLSKHYGPTVGVEDLDLDVEAGSVMGYLGPNGAGKTTTIRLLAGLLRPTRGHAEVLGLDVVAHVDRVQAQVGYLPGDFAAYGDLTGAQYLDFLARLRRVHAAPRIAELADRFDLDLGRRIGALSHGNRQKVGLLQAFLHDPDVLILDEPSAGLDPLMQREFLTLVRETRAAGRTVLLSSHILDEVEAVADRVAMLRRGRLVVVETVAALKARARHRIDLTFEHAPPVEELRRLAGVRALDVDGRTLRVTVEGSTADLIATAAPYRVSNVVSHEADLDEIFLAYYSEEVRRRVRERVPQDAA